MSSVGNSVRAIVDMSRFINHVLSRNNFYPGAQQSLTIIAKDRKYIDFHSQQKAAKETPSAPFQPAEQAAESRLGWGFNPRKTGFVKRCIDSRLWI
ncbi:hypothetical protein NJH78_19390 [Pseudomonas chlororaphis]|uniref:hypothetical protein n=1 Tax=Pseudomonas chlororaphis TaxID=587753 RepID=UPI00209B7ABF|nr:hypothetical protein [Pseudomonas chlororaphis]MCO7572152.1 hypothetical protein [Pseudomonas chlororaphis]MCO7589998.1 hypothetical protein [Pseudomonas chlororaphis]MCO7612598.1 hypothetical protein [Pseudomonas chlororaphis]